MDTGKLGITRFAARTSGTSRQRGPWRLVGFSWSELPLTAWRFAGAVSQLLTPTSSRYRSMTCQPQLLLSSLSVLLLQYNPPQFNPLPLPPLSPSLPHSLPKSKPLLPPSPSPRPSPPHFPLPSARLLNPPSSACLLL